MRKPIKATLGVTLVLLLVVGLVTVWRHYHPKTVFSFAAPVVRLSPVRVAPVPIDVSATATLQANQMTTISAKLTGYINELRVTEGACVSQGAVLVTLEDTKEQQAFRSAQAEAALTKSTFERYSKLSKTGVISKQDYDQYQAKHAQAIAAATAAARALQDTKLVAPFAGCLGPSHLSVGNLVTAGQVLLTLTDTSALRVQYTLPSRYAAQLKVGQTVRVTQPYLPGEVFNAVVNFVSPTVDAATQTIEVHASLDNQAQRLKPGQSVHVRQTLGTMPQALLVPMDAVMAEVEGNYVYRVTQHKVEQVSVTVGERYGKQRVVLSGLTPNDHVISDGQFNVHPGQQVDVAPTPAG